MRATLASPGLLCAALALALACGSGERTIETEGGTLEVERGGDEGHVEFRGEDGRRFEFSPQGGAGLPEGFPEDVPLVEGADTVMSSSSPGEGMMVMLQSDREAASIFESYKHELGRQGWSIAQETDMAGRHLILATKDDRKLNVMIGGGNGETRIALRLPDED